MSNTISGIFKSPIRAQFYTWIRVGCVSRIRFVCDTLNGLTSSFFLECINSCFFKLSYFLALRGVGTVGEWAFVIGLSQISSFFSVLVHIRSISPVLFSNGDSLFNIIVLLFIIYINALLLSEIFSV